MFNVIFINLPNPFDPDKTGIGFSEMSDPFNCITTYLDIIPQAFYRVRLDRKHWENVADKIKKTFFNRIWSFIDTGKEK